ncbi:MAG: 2Fe-2S iron-sulfur cluster binding domain-containing protein, partial [Oscillospiraceae bacterium]|nr:2Fe-2S iron-sulfur cluster binding domain-containing protein [Oscillospiraceae bacterium]
MSFCVTVCSREGETVLQAEKGQLISDLLKAAGMVAVFPCGGNGKCGRCRVHAQGLLEEPGAAEQAMLGDDYAKGIRLACMCHVAGDCR